MIQTNEAVCIQHPSQPKAIAACVEGDDEALQDGEEAVQEEPVKCAACKDAHRTLHECRVKRRHTAPDWNANFFPATPSIVSAASEPGKCTKVSTDGDIQHQVVEDTGRSRGYIATRCKKIHNKSWHDISADLVYHKSSDPGTPLRYRLTDLRYDLKHGYLKLKLTTLPVPPGIVFNNRGDPTCGSRTEDIDLVQAGPQASNDALQSENGVPTDKIPSCVLCRYANCETIAPGTLQPLLLQRVGGLWVHDECIYHVAKQFKYRMDTLEDYTEAGLERLCNELERPHASWICSRKGCRRKGTWMPCL